MSRKYGLISLGCPKNLVDSETFCYIAEQNGFRQSDEFDDLDFVLVNTCSFIHTAVDELIEVLKHVCSLRSEGKIRKVFVTGCIMKRHLENVRKQFPEVVAWIDLKDFKGFEKLISGKQLKQYYREQLTDGPFTYLRISDGCNNRCSYCTIPSIRGKHHSQPMEDLVREATYLANSGAKELIVIAQDTAAYGKDLYHKMLLPELLKKLHDIPGYHWIRLMYLHPKHVTNELVQTIAELPKVVHAFEIPLQHCNEKILSAMNRQYTKADIIRIYEMFKSAMPDAVFRTTFITGFPGEKRKHFNELKQFIQDYPFLRMGVFAYSLEGGTPALSMPDKVSETTATKRRDELLNLHRSLTEEYLAAYVGKELDVLIEEAYPEDNEFYGRAWFDAPEIDGVVQFTGKGIGYGDLVKIKIDDVIDIDLYGKLTKLVHKYDFTEAEE